MINDIFSNIGKRIRLSRILTREKAVIFAFDHGFEHGPKDFSGERVNPRTIVKIAVRNKFSALMTTRGIARATWDIWGGKIPLILKVTSKTSLRPKEEQLLQSPIGTVEDAIAIGADAIAATIYWGSPYEDVMIKNFLELTQSCEIYGFPIMMLAYPRGPTIDDRHDVEIVRYAARAGAELGADLIKTHYTGSTETFREVVKATPVPVLMSGGPKTDTHQEFLSTVRSVMDAGAAGLVVGRNIFQSDVPDKLAHAIKAIVFKKYTVEEAIKLLK